MQEKLIIFSSSDQDHYADYPDIEATYLQYCTGLGRLEPFGYNKVVVVNMRHIKNILHTHIYMYKFK